MSGKQPNEKYAAEFARWNAYDESSPYDAPGYCENPKVARAFVSSRKQDYGIIPAEDFWPVEGRHLLLMSSSNSPNVEGAGCMVGMNWTDDKGKDRFMRVCDFFTVVGSGEDEATGDSVLVLRFIDARRTVRTIIIPRSIIAQGDKTLAAHCQARGFNVATEKSGRAWLQHMLTNLHGPRLRMPTKAGWFDGTMQFVMPNGKIIGGHDDLRVFFSPAKSGGALVGKIGSAEKWSEAVTKLVPGNSRLELALSVAFTGPLLQFAPDVQPTLVNVFGESSRGKSITGFLCGSVCVGHTSRSPPTETSWTKAPAAHFEFSGLISGDRLTIKYNQSAMRASFNSRNDLEVVEQFNDGRRSSIVLARAWSLVDAEKAARR